MSQILQILSQYWGHKQFRPLQEDIIHSVLSGKDTLALLPTGGGKSVCFQVPALAMDGTCLVISPLIALMKDQVEQLKTKGISALAITSGMDKREIDIALDNVIYGKVKFLYLSPERLQSQLFLTRFKKMKINLIAVDESHCISQWGYDFRPPYLEIAKIRTDFPKVPVIALTATATPRVVDDIQEKLEFKTKNVFFQSFSRKNLAYIVRKEEDKLGRLLRICQRVKGSAVVYVRNRKKTKEIAEFLKNNGESADFYHAGLDPLLRNKKQDEWIKNKTRIIVSTNAFGMGIDKPNVRFVVHLDLPDSPEAYFQEAGRGGRDEKKAWAILLYQDADVNLLKQNLEAAFPPIETVKKVYTSLCNYFQVAIGSSMEQWKEFDLVKFTNHYQLPGSSTYYCLKLLHNANYIQFTEAIFQPSKIKVIVNNTELYNYQLKNPQADTFIQLLLRSYSGVFDDFVKINETELAKRMELNEAEIVKHLSYLDKQEVIAYVPRTTKPKICFPQVRKADSYFHLAPQVYYTRKEEARLRAQAMINYVTDTHHCRSRLLLKYFGENLEYRCGICDHCLKENRLQISNIEMEKISSEIKQLCTQSSLDLKQLMTQLSHHQEDKIKTIIRWLLDNDQLILRKGNFLQWNDEN